MLPTPTGFVKATDKLKVIEHDRMSVDEIVAFLNFHGISDKEFSELLGVTIQAVTLWKNGQRDFSVTNSRLLTMFHKYPKLIREF